MNDKETHEYYRDQLIILVVGFILFCIAMGIVYYVFITPHVNFPVLNDCTKEIVGNCVVK